MAQPPETPGTVSPLMAQPPETPGTVQHLSRQTVSPAQPSGLLQSFQLGQHASSGSSSLGAHLVMGVGQNGQYRPTFPSQVPPSPGAHILAGGEGSHALGMGHSAPYGSGTGAAGISPSALHMPDVHATLASAFGFASMDNQGLQAAQAAMKQRDTRSQIVAELSRMVASQLEVLKTQVTVALAAHVEAVLSQYARVIESFNSDIVTASFVNGAFSSAQASSDGNVYFRINEADISQLLVDVAKIRTDALTDIVDLRRRMDAVEARQSAGQVAGHAPPDASLEPGEPDTIGHTTVHRYTAAQSWLRAELARQAGLDPDRNSEEKIYHLDYWTTRLDRPMHDPSYVPHACHRPAEGTIAGQPAEYYKVRFDWSAGFDAPQNWSQFAGPVEWMLTNKDQCGVPEEFTEEDLKRHVIKGMYRTWSTEYKDWVSTPPEIRAANKIKRDRYARHQRMKKTKGLQRYDAAKAMLLGTPTGSNPRQKQKQKQQHQRPKQKIPEWDVLQANIYAAECQSEEDSDVEIDRITRVETPVRVRHEPEFRSKELTDWLRSLDPGRTTTVPIRSATALAPLRPGSSLKLAYPRWALRERWFDSASEAQRPTLLRNVGPWEGAHSVAASATSFGTGPFDATSSTRAIAATQHSGPSMGPSSRPSAHTSESGLGSSQASSLGSSQAESPQVGALGSSQGSGGSQLVQMNRFYADTSSERVQPLAGSSRDRDADLAATGLREVDTNIQLSQQNASQTRGAHDLYRVGALMN
ncbi:hypothetical protein OC834_005423 [Tilletia horrida]|nr:hypothetical protein OC834_005423 [Tilletia horrida]